MKRTKEAEILKDVHEGLLSFSREYRGRYKEIEGFYLFGSMARGDNTTESDIDILLKYKNLQTSDINNQRNSVFKVNESENFLTDITQYFSGLSDNVNSIPIQVVGPYELRKLDILDYPILYYNV